MTNAKSFALVTRSASNYRRVTFNLICGCGGTADALVSGSSVERRVGSNPVIRTKRNDRVLEALSFCFIRVVGFEGESVQSELPVDVRDRGRPSAQFARESNPVIRTK